MFDAPTSTDNNSTPEPDLVAEQIQQDENQLSQKPPDDSQFRPEQNELRSSEEEPSQQLKDIRNHPDYQALLTESIQRRRRIRELEQQLDRLQNRGGETREPEERSQSQRREQDPIIRLENRIQLLEQQLQDQRLRSARSEALQRAGLDPEWGDFITAKTPQEIQQQITQLKERIERVRPHVPRDNSDSGGQSDPVDTFRERIMERMNNGGVVDAFDLVTASQLGGGPIRNK